MHSHRLSLKCPAWFQSQQAMHECEANTLSLSPAPLIYTIRGTYTHSPSHEPPPPLSRGNWDRPPISGIGYQLTIGSIITKISPFPGFIVAFLRLRSQNTHFLCVFIPTKTLSMIFVVWGSWRYREFVGVPPPPRIYTPGCNKRMYYIKGFPAHFRHLFIQFHQFLIQFRPEKLTAFKSKAQFRQIVIHIRFFSIKFKNSAFKFVNCH